MAQKIAETVKPNAKKGEVQRLSDTEYRVSVQPPAQDGKANEAVIDLLADYFGIA
jgi:uncharacterized protein YggU (UPF0235/DUF167 family)